MFYFYNIIIFIIVFLFIVLIFTLIITKKKKNVINKKLKEIDSESKLLAIDDLRRIIKKDPYNFIARDKLAGLLINNKSYLSAIKEYLIIIDHSHSNPEINEIEYLNKIGNIYLLMENIEDAKKYFLISKSKDDLNIEANIRLGDIEMLKNNYEKADFYYNLAYKIEPENLELKKAYAICNYKLNSYKAASEKLIAYLNQKSDDEEAIFYLAFSYYYLNNFEEAVKNFMTLKLSNTYSTESFFMLGTIRINQRKYIQAIEDFNNCLIKGSYNDINKIAEINYLIAECYFQNNDLNKSIEYWQKVFELDPNYKDVRLKLNNYSDISSNYYLEMYLIGSVNQFIKICKMIVQYYIKHFSTLKGKIKFLELNTSSEGSLEILTEVTSGNFLEQHLFVFLRSATTIGDVTIREHYNTLKEKKADKGICVTAGSFSESVKQFIESRMIKLIEREQLIDILDSINREIKNK
jgi:tetratricopeptide (TPR) repeat protein